MKRCCVKTFWGYDFPKLDAKVNAFLKELHPEDIRDIKYTSFVNPVSTYEYLTATVIYEGAGYGQDVQG